MGKNLKYDPPDPADPADAQDKKNAAAYAKWLVGADDGTIANALICLIHQTNYLLDQHVKGLERDFVDGGGYSEQLAAARLAKRASETDNKPKEQGKMPHPVCLVCGKPMVLRTARKGPHVGKQFLGCSGYPDCKATLAVA